MSDLFDRQAQKIIREHAPLAERMRPQSLQHYFGQQKLTAHGALIQRMIDSDQIKSMIFWGPPGTGKTTLARIIAASTSHRFISISAVRSGVKDLQRIMQDAGDALKYEQRSSILFIDEIHRFNKAQQDVLLHHVEEGQLIVIGATTENPSFEINSALLSRMRVVVLDPLSEEALLAICDRALQDQENGLAALALDMDEKSREELLRLASGDARRLLNVLELAAEICQRKQSTKLDAASIREAAGKPALLYDKSGEGHYNTISAFIKSMRGSDPDAALYYLATMLESGEDPLFIARRVVIFASEDIGNADPQALSLAVACKESVHFIGMPEALYPLSQCVVYLASAPKSNASGKAFFAARAEVRRLGPQAVPMHIRNAPTQLMKNLGYGKGYEYPHDADGHFVAKEYLPAALQGSQFYYPGELGFEKEIQKRLDYWNKLKGKL